MTSKYARVVDVAEMNPALSIPVQVGGHASGPASRNEASGDRGGDAAQEGITRASEDRDQRADRRAQQCAATDAGAVGGQSSEPEARKPPLDKPRLQARDVMMRLVNHLAWMGASMTRSGNI